MTIAMGTSLMHRKSREGDPTLCRADDQPMFKLAGPHDKSIVIPALTELFFVHGHFSAHARPRNLREVPPDFLDAFGGYPIPPRSEWHIKRYIVARSVSAGAAVGSFDSLPYIDPHVLWYLLGGNCGLQGLAVGDRDNLQLNVFLLEDRFGKDRFVYLGSRGRLWDLHIDSMPGRELLLEGDAVFVTERIS
ncbi:MAG: hypothetical protein EXS60_00745 [Candidatus Pacebacteria bacterium]|nr:hypothetical protein [Candidatus Paceibacterota bacterium]